MRQLITFAIIAVLPSACVPSSQKTGILPTFPPSLTTAPPLLSQASVPSKPIFTDFPLSAGTIWKYSGEITYQNPNDQTQTETWSGFITDTVVEQNTMLDGRLLFTYQENMEPTTPEGVWRKPSMHKYTASEDGIFRDDIKIFQWPLSDNLTWEAIPGTMYDMNVNYIGEVDTPYGSLKGCYTLLLATLPDSTLDTFCPSIGFVEHKYQHNGDRQDEHFVLVSYETLR